MLNKRKGYLGKVNQVLTHGLGAFLRVLEAGELATEGQQDGAGSPLTVLGSV